MTRAWFLLTIAGLFEVGWAVGLKLSDGFSRPWVTTLTGLSMLASVVVLGIAVKEIPIGTAYAVWVGIGVVGTFACGLVMLGEPFSWTRTGLVLLLIVSIVGLKLTSPA